MKGKIPKKSKSKKGCDFIKFKKYKYNNSYLQEISNYKECKNVSLKKNRRIILIDITYNT